MGSKDKQEVKKSSLDAGVTIKTLFSVLWEGKWKPFQTMIHIFIKPNHALKKLTPTIDNLAIALAFFTFMASALSFLQSYIPHAPIATVHERLAEMEGILGPAKTTEEMQTRRGIAEFTFGTDNIVNDSEEMRIVALVIFILGISYIFWGICKRQFHNTSAGSLRLFTWYVFVAAFLLNNILLGLFYFTDDTHSDLSYLIAVIIFPLFSFLRILKGSGQFTGKNVLVMFLSYGLAYLVIAIVLLLILVIAVAIQLS